MTPPAFFDQGIRFTVAVPNHALLGGEELAWLESLGNRVHGLSDVQRHALVLLHQGRELTNRTFRNEFPMDSRDARRALSELVDRGLADGDGDRGGRIYRLGASLTPQGERKLRRPRQSQLGPVLAQLEQGERSVAAIVAGTELSQRQVSYALSRLRDAGRVEIAVGGQGRPTLYRLVAP
jgi:ATP-dependent DNA helicase RecG